MPDCGFSLTGACEPPPGELVLVLQKHGSWLELFRKPKVYFPGGRGGQAPGAVEARRLSRQLGSPPDWGDMIHETVTTPAADVLARAKAFFAERVPNQAAWVELEGPTFMTLRGQGRGEDSPCPFSRASLPGSAPPPSCLTRRWGGSPPCPSRRYRPDGADLKIRVTLIASTSTPWWCQPPPGSPRSSHRRLPVPAPSAPPGVRGETQGRRALRGLPYPR